MAADLYEGMRRSPLSMFLSIQIWRHLANGLIGNKQQTNKEQQEHNDPVTSPSSTTSESPGA